MPARILVIEDNAANLDLITYLLEAFGHITYSAEDGESGLKMIRHELPDLILCDLQLPGISGYEVANQVKGHPALKQIPLVAVTAYAMVGDRDAILAAGFDGYIPKPILPETFLKQVEAFLPTSKRSSGSPHTPPTESS
jgi:two-component system cell cycle response regulator